MQKILIAALVSLFAASASAQTPAVVRGTIAAISGDALTMTSRTGEAVAVKLSPKTRVAGVVKASAKDLTDNAFIGVAAVPGEGDDLMALEVHIFPEAMRGAGEGYRPFDLKPNSSMTNGAINAKVSGVDGDTLTVAYKGGQRRIHVPADAPIVALQPGDRADLKVGAAAIARGPQGADGAIEAAAVLVGKDGVVPPM